LGYQITKNDIGRVCGAYGGKKSSIQGFDRETRKKTLGRPRHKWVILLKSIPQNGFHKM
jgi:hypothetical protein